MSPALSLHGDICAHGGCVCRRKTTPSQFSPHTRGPASPRSPQLLSCPAARPAGRCLPSCPTPCLQAISHGPQPLDESLLHASLQRNSRTISGEHTPALVTAASTAEVVNWKGRWGTLREDSADGWGSYSSASKSHYSSSEVTMLVAISCITSALF